MNENAYQSPSSETKVDKDAILLPEVLHRLQREIKNLADASVLAGTLGIFCLVFIPCAFICGRRAIRLMDEHDIGHAHRRRAKRGVSLGYVGVVVAVLVAFVALCQLLITTTVSR